MWEHIAASLTHKTQLGVCVPSGQWMSPCGLLYVMSSYEHLTFATTQTPVA